MARKRAARAIVALTTLGACLLHVAAWGLGLGELVPRSALNQPFRADIELVQVRNLEVAEIVPKLASREDFERLGVERFFFLTALDFEVDLSDRNHPVIHVSSKTPVTEPYLDFVVEVLWPSGRLLKEYTVLLDPPAFSGRDAEPVAAAAPASGSASPGPGAAPADAPGPTANARPSSPGAAAPGAQAAASPVNRRSQPDVYGVTDRDDTLWEIALAARPPGATVQQTMLSIVRMNPEAFIDGNINLLKAGYKLKLPSSDDIAISDAEAVAEVARQNVAWQQRRTGATSRPAQLDAGGRTARAGTPSDDDGGSLRLVTGEPDASPTILPATTATGRATSPAPSSADADLGGRAAELADELAVREEEVDRLQRDNADLRTRVGSLEAQLEQAEELRAANDARIAQMEAQIEELRRLAQAPRSGGAPPPPAAAEGSGFGAWLFALLAVLVVGLLVAVLVMWRRLSEDSGSPILVEDEHLEDTQVVERTPARDVTSAAADANLESTEILEPEDHVSPMDKTTVLSPDELPDANAESEDAETTAAPETSDIIGEADIYIAYGRFPQAISFLRNALEAEPDRNDVRLKLMEVFVETRDVDAFNAEGARLVESATEEELYRARQLQAKLPGASVVAVDEASDADEVDMDATMIDTEMNVAEIARAAKGPSLDLDLNLSDPGAAQDSADSPPLDIDLNLDGSALDTAADEDDVDFELDIDMDDEAAATEANLRAGGSDTSIVSADDHLDRTGRTDLLEDDAAADLGGDLGMDFDFEEDETAVEPDPNDTLGEFNLSGLDLTSDGVSRVERPEGGLGGEDFESTIEKSIEKQLAEHGDSGAFELSDLEFEQPAAADSAADADDLSGLDLTIDGSQVSLSPVPRTGALDNDDFDLDTLDAEDDDGLSLTLDGNNDATTEMEVDTAAEFDLDALDLGDEGLDRTVGMDEAEENLDETIAMRDVRSGGNVPAGTGEVLDETIAMSDDSEDLGVTVKMDDDDDFGSEFDLGGDSDEVQAKLELARALIDSNDADGARDILAEVVEEGDEGQRDTASELLAKLG